MNNGDFLPIAKQVLAAVFVLLSAVGTYLGHYAAEVGEKIFEDVKEKVNSEEWRDKTLDQLQDSSSGIWEEVGNLVETKGPLLAPQIKDIGKDITEDLLKSVPDNIKESVKTTVTGSGDAPQVPSATPDGPAAPVSQNLAPSTQNLTGLKEPFNTLLTQGQDAVVNILCTTVSGNAISVTTGSGVIVHESGIIMTNAHVAQDLLFTDPARPPVIDCVTRQGHLSSSLYKTSVLYMPITWAQAHRHIRTDPNPKGSGEGDYALLAITKNALGGALPESFPFIPPTIAYRDPKGEQVLVIGYPAESVKTGIKSGVPMKYAVAKISAVFTLDGNRADILETSANSVAERGSSGGALVAKDGHLIGLIDSVHSPNQATASAQNKNVLQAISLPYIMKHFSSEGVSILKYAEDPTTITADFSSVGEQIRSLVE